MYIYICRYSKAADLGFANAQFNLALSLQEGEGMEVDYERALYWLEKAALHGHAMALFTLGNIHMYVSCIFFVLIYIYIYIYVCMYACICIF